MQNQKKTITIWVCLLLCLLQCACGQETSAPAPTAEAPAASATLTPAPTPEPEALPKLVISEVMADNCATLADGDGSFPDWVELRNLGDAPALLEGLSLRCGGTAWALPAQQLEPGGCTVLFCSKEKTGFGISREGELLILHSARGTVLDHQQLPELEKDCAWTREAGVTCWPTPGYENSAAGYALFQQSRTADGLAIGEAAVYDEDGDWVELVNTGGEPVQLADYRLSDKGGERLRGVLPEKLLGTGERCLLPLEKLGFGLNAQRDELYLSRADGRLQDYVSLHLVPPGGSVGRLTGEGGFFYFAAPTPGGENAEGFRRVSAVPICAEGDGVFEDVTDVTVSLSAAGEIHYTTDGSCPTAASPRYTEPIVLTQTGVVRAVSIEEDALPSRALTLSCFLNEGHTLPVVSLVCEPWEIDSNQGIYKQVYVERETAGAVAFYDGEERFAADCGIRLHGATSRLKQEKKSFKLSFRSRYGGDLHYDLFHNGVEDFASILLRAPQEPGGSSLLRDSLLHELAAEAFPALPTQASRYAVLYINGRYWGVYSLREAHSASHYANHYGRDLSCVEQTRAAWSNQCGFTEVYNRAIASDLRKDENYEALAAHLDTDSVIGWTIIQAYCGNIDGHCSNMRFYYTYDDEKLHYGLVDLDHGMEDYPGFTSPFEFGYRPNALARALLANAGYRQAFFRQLEAALEGPLKPERVIARIDEMAAELRPEMARDRERWHNDLATWERLVENNRNYFRNYQEGRYDFTLSLAEYVGSTPEYKAWREAHQNGY